MKGLNGHWTAKGDRRLGINFNWNIKNSYEREVAVEEGSKLIRKNRGMNGHCCKIGGGPRQGVYILTIREKMEGCFLVCGIKVVSKKMSSTT